MNKIFTLLAAMLFAFSFAQAQRSADLTISQWISPTELQSTETGTKFTVSFVLKNNGPDVLTTTDSFAMFFLVTTGTNNTKVLEFPKGAPNTVQLYAFRKELNVGDTMLFSLPLTTNLIANVSLPVNLIGSASPWNRSNAITDPVTNNNANGALNTTWWNKYRDGVSVESIYNENINIYPNPVSDLLLVKLNNVRLEEAFIEVIDLNGKVWLSENAGLSFVNGSYSVDVNNIPSGLYFVKVTNGETISTTKVSIQH